MWKIVIKVNALLVEVVSVLKIPNNKGNLTDNEKNWLQSLNIYAVNNLAIKHLENWEVRLDKSQLENLLKGRKIFKLFFNGASKGNPGRAGVGGVVTDLDGKVEIEYYGNIGQDPNNMDEAYGLWQGLKQLKKKGVEEVMVFGDSRLIIQALNGGRRGKNERTERMINRIKSMAKMFRKIEFFHILRELNVLADIAANKYIAIGVNDLIVNSVVSTDIPPYLCRFNA